jgi:hypothetical protein
MRELGEQVLAGRSETDSNASDAAASAALGGVPGASDDVEEDSPLSTDDSDFGVQAQGQDGDIFEDDDVPAQGQQDGQAPPSRAIAEAFKARNMGWDEDVTDEDIIAEFQHTNTLLAQQQEELNWYRQQAAAGGQGNQGAGSAAPAPGTGATGGASPAPGAPKLPEFKVDAPEWDPAWEAGLKVDEEGTIVAKPGWDPSLPGKYNRFKQWESQQISTLARNPYLLQMAQNPQAFLEQIVRPMAEQIATARTNELAGQYQRQSEDAYINQIRAQAGYLNTNAAGQVVRHAKTGQVMLTPEGQAFEREFAALLQDAPGMSRVKAAELASRLHPPRKAAAPARQTNGGAAPAQRATSPTYGQRLGGTVHQPRRTPANRIPTDGRGLPDQRALGEAYLREKQSGAQ